GQPAAPHPLIQMFRSTWSKNLRLSVIICSNKVRTLA
ncbi:Os06g0365450, partial [Oryza sativa Japonica Group]